MVFASSEVEKILSEKIPSRYVKRISTRNQQICVGFQHCAAAWHITSSLAAAKSSERNPRPQYGAIT